MDWGQSHRIPGTPRPFLISAHPLYELHLLMLNQSPSFLIFSPPSCSSLLPSLYVPPSLSSVRTPPTLAWVFQMSNCWLLSRHRESEKAVKRDKVIQDGERKVWHWLPMDPCTKNMRRLVEGFKMLCEVQDRDTTSAKGRNRFVKRKEHLEHGQASFSSLH